MKLLWIAKISVKHTKFNYATHLCIEKTSVLLKWTCECIVFRPRTNMHHNQSIFINNSNKTHYLESIAMVSFFHYGFFDLNMAQWNPLRRKRISWIFTYLFSFDDNICGIFHNNCAKIYRNSQSDFVDDVLLSTSALDTFSMQKQQTLEITLNFFLTHSIFCFWYHFVFNWFLNTKHKISMEIWKFLKKKICAKSMHNTNMALSRSNDSTQQNQQHSLDHTRRISLSLSFYWSSWNDYDLMCGVIHLFAKRHNERAFVCVFVYTDNAMERFFWQLLIFEYLCYRSEIKL